MKRLVLSAAASLLLSGAALAGSAEDLLEADRAFSSMSASEGTAKAFIAYSADEVRMFGTSGGPTFGKTALEAHYASPEGAAAAASGTLTWEPSEGFVSSDGLMGWTHGTWTFVTVPDANGASQTATGYYLTVWREEADGSWKVVADMGTTNPPANEPE